MMQTRVCMVKKRLPIPIIRHKESYFLRPIWLLSYNRLFAANIYVQGLQMPFGIHWGQQEEFPIVQTYFHGWKWDCFLGFVPM